MSVLKVLTATKPFCRTIHCSQVLHEDPRLKNIKKWQEIFQRPDGVPVYLKRGMTDRLMLGFIVLGTAVGLGYSFNYLYEEIIKP